jgi:hypothetical protein
VVIGGKNTYPNVFVVIMDVNETHMVARLLSRVWEIQILKCYHFSLSTIDNFDLKDYFVTILCQIVS